MKRVVLLVALALLLVPTVALADAVLDFVIAPPHPSTAVISYDGQGGPLIGTDIAVIGIVGVNTPLNSGVLVPIDGGLLDFSTGPSAGDQPGQWFFGSGPDSFIRITGAIAGVSCPDCVLLDGGFGSASVTNIGGDFKIAGASFYDYKCLELLRFYGLLGAAGAGAWAPFSGYFNISFTAAGTPPGGFTSLTIGSGDVYNPVPEPGTLALLGTGLLSIAGFVRRKLTS
jgi:hypothetical protein